jgi:succinoglycan biosynthesis transport protein ExoP
MRRANAILTLDEKTSVINQSYTELSSALAKLEQERIKAEAQYTEMARNPQSSTQVLENKTVQAFKEQKAKLEAEYLVNLGTYKPEFPQDAADPRADRPSWTCASRPRWPSVLASVKSQFDAAKRQEDQVRVRLQDTRKEVLVSQDRSVDLSLLKRELDTNRQIYDNLLQRLKEVGVTSGVAANNISVVDAAKAPLFPFKPDMSVNAAIGLAVGLMLGLGLHLRAGAPGRFGEARRRGGGPVWRALLGIIPQVKKSKLASAGLARLAVDDPRGAVCRGLPLHAHGAAVFHLRRRAETADGDQQRVERGQVDHGTGAGHQLCAAGPARAAGRRRHAQPLDAQGAGAAQ